MCDVDHFKSYNNHFGHLAGDEVLRRVARTIREELREGDRLFRYGGEEFVVSFPSNRWKETGAMEPVRGRRSSGSDPDGRAGPPRTS